MCSSADPRCPLVIIADAHISHSKGNAAAFFEMLTALEQGAGDVVFLGDIFELWIALPRYEDDLHRAFLSWCQRQKRQRRIGFIEGNHEFFLARRHPESFTWCTHLAWWQDTDGNLFCHGDRINRYDRNYLTFRKLTKNPVTRSVLQWLPLGPMLAGRVKNRLKGTNQAFRKTLPVEQLRQFAEQHFLRGAARIFLGHFHQAFHYRGNHGGELYALPDWHSNGWISVLTNHRQDPGQGPWQEILPILP